MGGKGDLEGVDALVTRLEEVGGEWAPAVAAIWTWLEQHPRLLGSLKEKTPAIRDKGKIQAMDGLFLAMPSRNR